MAKIPPIEYILVDVETYAHQSGRFSTRKKAEKALAKLPADEQEKLTIAEIRG